jgi:hypothetical protein
VKGLWRAIPLSEFETICPQADSGARNQTAIYWQ